METIAENIAKLYQDLDDKQNRKAILNHYLNIDESNLWPINGDFNATKRAINRMYKFEREGGYYLLGLELCYFLEGQISDIVNSVI